MALHIRRSQIDVRFEMMPLIDVVFLLLTFFIYAMVLMIRAHLLPVQLPQLSAGEIERSGEVIKAVSITLDDSGILYVDGKEAEIGGVIELVTAFKHENPSGRVYVAPDIMGKSDRLPVFIELINRLRESGIDEFFIVGMPVANQDNVNDEQ